MREWFDSVAGAALLRNERELCSDILSNLFGYHLVQLGRVANTDMLEASRIKHRMRLVDRADETGGADISNWCGRSDQLALASDSIDVLLLPHTLEYEANPHQILREVERSLIPEGHVVIAGFNPWSLWGVVRLFLGWRGKTPWCGHFYTTTRIKDWLALLGFDTVLVRYHTFVPPLHHAGILQKLAPLEAWGAGWWPILGGAYILVAKKRVTTLTPIRPRWRPRRSMLGSSLAEPTARNIQK